MSNRDFFSFCTTLTPVERRAMGELSMALHVPEGTTLYSLGEESDAIYIVSRGMLTVVPDANSGNHTGVYLSRGDMLGAAEVITGSARVTSAMACEDASLQRIPAENLGELARRIPTFAIYLAEQLSWRLLQTDEQYHARSNCLEFSGNLRNFDIVAIVQTIYNSSKTGELAILNEDGESVAGMYFREGRPLCVQCHHLTGMEAFWQIFLQERMSGSFNFTPSEEMEDIRQELPLNRGVDDMLINAVRQRDEFQMIMEVMPPFESHLHRTGDFPEWTGDSSLRPAMEAILNLIDRQRVRLDEMFWLCNFSELTLYSALVELVRSGAVSALGAHSTVDSATIIAA